MKKAIFFVMFLCLCFLNIVALAQTENVILANEYFNNGELEKSVTIYEKLARDKDRIYEIHRNYLDALMKLQRYEEAEKYLRRQVKNFPAEGMFQVDVGVLLSTRGKPDEAAKHYETYMNSVKDDDNQIRQASRYFINASLFDYAEQLYLQGRKNAKSSFSYELATLYAISGKTEKMIHEYMEMMNENSEQTEYVQNVLQSRLRDEDEFAKIEPILYKFIQKYPEQIAYNEMLIWYFIQNKEFSKAFLQAKSIDKRKRLEGSNLYDIGMLAMENKDYGAAIKIFEYLVEKYKEQRVYLSSRRMLVKSKEEQVKNTFPVDYAKIRSLAGDYQQILRENGFIEYTAEAARSLAHLQAFYLNRKDSAIIMLEKAISTPNMRKDFVAQSKLDLGDIYLLKSEPWEATLLYSQVEKAEKNANINIGQMAKLKNAKLSYYKGEFEYAKEYLDVLKLATSREIANDAMQLSLLIGDNLELDTSSLALEGFAAADLLVFQSQYDEALKDYDKILKTFAGHSLTDEIYWAKANIFLKQGKFESCVELLKKIIEEYNDDILADDANFTLGKVYEENLKDTTKAMEYYQNQLLKYQGSIFTSEARKRFRALRGDKVN